MAKRIEETCPRCKGWVWHRSEPCNCPVRHRGQWESETLIRDIGARVKECRQGLRLSLEDLAKMSGRSKTMLWQIEAAQSEPGAETLARLASALQVTIDYLVLGD